MRDVARVTARGASPGLRYKDVEAAIAWLCRAFGFTLRTTEADENGVVVYAELSFGSTIIMIGAVSGFDIGQFMKQPGDIGGAATQCCYYVVDDIDAHYARALHAGAEVVIGMQTRPNGARAFTCRDPEGHLWCFGTYDPWQSLSIAPDQTDPAPKVEASPGDRAIVPYHPRPKFPARLAAGLSIGAIVSGLVAAWVYGDAWQTSREATAAPTAFTGPERVISIEVTKETFQNAIKSARRRLVIERRTRRAAERATKAAQAEVAEERKLRIAAEEAAKKLQEQLAQAQQAADQARTDASAAQKDLAKELAKEKAAAKTDQRDLARQLEQAQRAAEDARVELAKAKEAKAAAEQEAKRTRARLTFVSHQARKDSEQAIVEIRKQLQDETAAREAAERNANSARNDLARERQLKRAAWETVDVLKKRLAATGVKVVSQQKKAVAKKKVPKPAAGQPTSTAANNGSDKKGWSLYSGPAFYKNSGAP